MANVLSKDKQIAVIGVLMDSPEAAVRAAIIQELRERAATEKSKKGR